MNRIPHNARWVIVSVNKPLMVHRSDGETWLINPRRRYVFNAELLRDFGDYIENMSDLQAATHYRPLHSAPTVRLAHSSLLIERYRDRGLGDLLFLTGPLSYLHHLTGNDIKCHLYAYADRGSILNLCPYLADGSPLVGPILYDDLPLYDFHWFADTVTEYTEEPDQLNVYDALYRSLGIDPENVDPLYKRPTAQLAPSEARALDDFYYWAYQNTPTHLDLRKTGYYVIAPFTNSNLRSAKYDTWIRVINSLTQRRPVLVVGAMRERMPTTDISPGEFVNIINSDVVQQATNGRIINLLGRTSVRNLMQLISKANAVGSMDSAALYIAQAFRVPCVSLWGSHDPGIRIGYDSDYMRLAVWNQAACAHSPCFAWQGFPPNKCPKGEDQTICECLLYADEREILKRFDMVEAERSIRFKPATPKAELPQKEVLV